MRESIGQVLTLFTAIFSKLLAKSFEETHLEPVLAKYRL
jgi:hypothetical protein